MEQNSDLSVPVEYNVGKAAVRLTVTDTYQARGTNAGHWHDDWEFFAPIAGQLQVRVAGRTYTVAQGAGLLVNSGRLHHLLLPAGQDCQFIDLAINPDLLAQLPGVELAAIRQKMAPGADDVVELHPVTPWQGTVLDRLHLLGNAYRYGGSEPLTVATEALALCTRVLPRISVRAADEREQTGTQLVYQMVDYVQAHYQGVLTTNAIAASVHISRSQCFSLFQAVLHVGPGAYVQRVRLEHAATLLRTTQMPVAAIAQDCGFKSASHLVALFKETNGLTPRRYRLQFMS